ncbi:MAG: hypothetical protein D4R64_13385 [Porphyromonadaceae bacterium]|nr:MAG: hypothetical protein D4R64_13385 [Porphyromonadaceae bacterium]
MKKKLLSASLTAIALMVILPAWAQKTEVPEVAKKAFATKFTEAKSVKWSSESATEFEAEFKLNGKEMSANFNKKGEWLETEVSVEKADLPAAVLKTIESQFAGYKLDEIASVETPGMKAFEVSLAKEKEEIEVTIDPKGKVIKKTDAKEEEEEDAEVEGKEIKVSEAVTSAFSKKFPTAQSVKWGEEKEGDAEADFEAEFKLNGKEMSANFNSKGEWLETELTVEKTDLPANVLKTIESQFAGYKLGDMASVETPKMKAFEISLKKGKEEIEVVIDLQGKVIKKVDAKEEEEEEEKEK